MPNEFSTGFSTRCGKLNVFKDFGFYAVEKLEKRQLNITKSASASAKLSFYYEKER